LSQPTQVILSGLRNNYGENVSSEKWNSMTPEEQANFIVDELNEKAIQNITNTADIKTDLVDKRTGKVVDPSKIKLLAKEAGVTQSQYQKDFLDVKYYTLGKSFNRKEPGENGRTATERKAAEKLEITTEQLDSIKNFPMEINVEDVSVIGDKGTSEKFELINKLAQNMVEDIPGKGLKLKQIEGGDVEFLLGSTSMGTASIEDMTSEDVKKFVYKIYGGSPKKIGGLSSEVLPQVQDPFFQNRTN